MPTFFKFPRNITHSKHAYHPFLKKTYKSGLDINITDLKVRCQEGLISLMIKSPRGDTMKIGERIKSTRIDKDQTQKQIGEILGVTEKQISRWEKDTQEMGIWKLKDFCLY